MNNKQKKVKFYGDNETSLPSYLIVIFVAVLVFSASAIALGAITLISRIADWITRNLG